MRTLRLAVVSALVAGLALAVAPAGGARERLTCFHTPSASQTTGLTCRAGSGHGFFIAREKRRTFSAHAAARPRVRIVDATVPLGGTLVAKGTGWPALATVELLIGPPQSEASHVANVRTSSSGRFTKKIRISSRASTGKLVLLACRRACRVKAAAAFWIVRN